MAMQRLLFDCSPGLFFMQARRGAEAGRRGRLVTMCLCFSYSMPLFPPSPRRISSPKSLSSPSCLFPSFSGFTMFSVRNAPPQSCCLRFLYIRILGFKLLYIMLAAGFHFDFGHSQGGSYVPHGVVSTCSLRMVILPLVWLFFSHNLNECGIFERW